MYAHFLWHALRLRLDSKHRVPLSMNVHVTGRCCNRCAYCGYEASGPDRLSLAVLRQVFQEAYQLGGRRVNLTGGEALLREDLGEVMQAARQAGFFVSLATSGVGVERQLEALDGCDQVMLSFDGPLEVRAQLCGQLAAEESEKAVRLFAERGIAFWTTTVLTRQSIPHIEWIVEHARRHRSYANFVPLEAQESDGLRFHPSAEALAELRPSDQEHRQAVGRLIELKRAGAPVGSSMPYLEEWFGWSDYSRLQSTAQSRAYRRCIALRSTCELRADGRLDACSMAFASGPGVSIFDGGFAHAFGRLPIETNCRSCLSSCMLESNLIFSLNPRTIWNWARCLR